LAEGGAEFGRGEDFGVGAPAEYPLFHFGEGAEAEAEFEGAVGKVAHFLRFVPFAFADALGDGGREADDDVVVAGATEDAEGVGEEFFGREIGGAGEGFLGGGDVGDAREGEGAQGVAFEVVPDEIPQVFAVREMVRADAARGFFFVSRFSIREADFVLVEDGGAEGVEDGEVGFAEADVFERDGLEFVGGGKGNAIAKTAGEFFEGSFELAVEGRAAVLLQSALGDEEGKEFAFGDVDGGEGGDGMGVAVGLDLSVEFDGEIEAIAHEGDVADDGFARDAEQAHELGAVGQRAAAKLLMDLKHALQGWAGKLDAGRHGHVKIREKVWSRFFRVGQRMSHPLR
jgi:hypothetical protein